QPGERAVQHFEAALGRHQQRGARPVVARTQYAYAAMLAARNAPGEAAHAQAHLTLAHTTAQHCQLRRFTPRLLEMRSRLCVASTKREPALADRPQGQLLNQVWPASQQNTFFAKKAIIGPWRTRGEPVPSKTPEDCAGLRSSYTHRVRNSTSSTS